MVHSQPVKVSTPLHPQHLRLQFPICRGRHTPCKPQRIARASAWAGRKTRRSAVDGVRKERRGFASMSIDKQREIASKGGRAAHEKGTAHEWTPDEARSAGRKGGQISRGGRGRLVPPTAPMDVTTLGTAHVAGMDRGASTSD